MTDTEKLKHIASFYPDPEEWMRQYDRQILMGKHHSAAIYEACEYCRKALSGPT